MKKIMLVMVGLLLVAGVAWAKDYVASKEVGGMTVTMSIDRNPPVVGENGVSVSIAEKDGAKVTDAKVVVEYSMPAMMGMPPMNYKTTAELKGDGYKAKMDLSMAGSWNIAVKVTRGGKTSTAKFTVDAR